MGALATDGATATIASYHVELNVPIFQKMFYGRLLYRVSDVILCKQCHRILRWHSTSFDPYKILNIPRTADKAAIKSAYLRMAKLYHPDRNPSDSAAKLKFENVQNAYRFLMEQISKNSEGT